MKLPNPRQQFHKKLKQKKTEFKGNPLLKREDVHIEFTPEMLAEIAKCEADPIYFIEKYMKIASLNHEDYEDAINGLIPFKLYNYQKKIIRSFRDYRMNVVVTARQAGKDLDITTPIKTPTGWKTIKDIEIGDQVFGSNGKPINVIGISPIFKNHFCYKLTFSDNNEITCSEEHLWTVWNETKQKEETLKAADIANSKDELYIKNAKPFDYGTQYDREDINYFREGTRWQRNADGGRIPEYIMKASIPNRILYLQGMCEAGETMHMRNGECNIGFGTMGSCFKEKYSAFIEDVYEFLASMGSYARIRYMMRNHVTFAFNISKEQFPVKRWKPRRKRCGHQIEAFTHPSQHMRRIVNIEPVASVLTKCISVDSEDQLFCVGYGNILTHNSTIACGFILWYILFNEAKKVGILANKEKTAVEILNKVRIAYQYLPLWLKQGTVEFAKEKIVLENQSMVMAASTSSDSIRGWTLDLLFIDECAHIEKWDEFYTSTVPTITSGKRSKLILVSTPNGMNHFYDFCRGAEYEKTDPEKWNGFRINKVMWNEVPGRGKIWYKEALAALGNDIDKFNQENLCQFNGSSGTLISGSKLSELIAEPYLEPSYGPIRIYDRVKKGHKYVATVDVSRGKGLDYSALSIIDVTQMPFKQVVSYKNNQITPLDFTFIVLSLCKQYNNAFVLVEVNDIGEQVSQSLFHDHGYEYIISTSKLTHGNKRVTVYTGNAKNPDRGLRMTSVVKKLGCMQLKLIVEQNQLIIPDYWTIDELKTFAKRGNSWEAEEGKHDDLVMTLVLFSWLTLQPWFITYFEKNALEASKEMKNEEEELAMAMFGLIDNTYKEPHEHMYQSREVIFHNMGNSFNEPDAHEGFDFTLLE